MTFPALGGMSEVVRMDAYEVDVTTESPPLRQSTYPILRADYFIAATSIEPLYSKFLNLPPKFDDLEKQFHVDREGVKKKSTNSR